MDSDLLTSLSSESVDVWQTNLKRSLQQIQFYQTILSPDEQKRAQRFKFEKDQQAFIIARGTLRMILSQYLSLSPEQIKFKYTSKGKPSLDQDPLPLHFNLSHAYGKAIYAIALDKNIGVDIEYLRKIEVLSLAKRFFCDSEYQWLNSLSLEEQYTAFFKLWTCKEAYLKATGEGLVGLQDIEIKTPLSSSWKILQISQNSEIGENWTLQTIETAENYVATLALEGINYQFNTWQWIDEE
ncbi:4'-phosphopantetheinyl transferase HetI [Planktothrix serta PCC 8927]|uniref:4'-phosphopantetheinyl transferase HetI n=1 Tax=Planktothrix serta PCC 8927 TaxID=671068 RepID=A0A7Z9BXB4_9CYAN|nr:4'-phosphopantetheinyl transferase superfamily protein [Planktothrix serta]VXD21732.1 4'-phosphopantetheinyl transferase HetI [Planktothrix serta PCC 8927]